MALNILKHNSVVYFIHYFNKSALCVYCISGDFVNEWGYRRSKTRHVFCPQKHIVYLRESVCVCVCVCARARTLCNPRDLPGSAFHGISQARILEWVAISYFRGSSWSRNWTHVSCSGGQILYHCTHVRHWGDRHQSKDWIIQQWYMLRYTVYKNDRFGQGQRGSKKTKPNFYSKNYKKPLKCFDLWRLLGDQMCIWFAKEDELYKICYR